MAQIVYTVHAYRWGNRQGGTSYTVGVYSSEERALKAADTEEVNRGHKYSCEVLRWTLDKGDEDSDEDAFEVVRPLPGEAETAP